MSAWDHIALCGPMFFDKILTFMVDISKAYLCRQIIYRLACLGFDDTVTAYGGLAAFSNQCRTKQIKVLLSPMLVTKSRHTARHVAEAGVSAPSAV